MIDVRRHGDVPDLIADPALAGTHLGFEPTGNVETMCGVLRNWTTRNPMEHNVDGILSAAQQETKKVRR